MATKKASTRTAVAETAERVTVLNLKGSAEFKAWLGELSDFSHMPTATVFDVAVTDLAKKLGFSKPAPKRQMR
jgi:putative exporter of polyketide antibiotics